MRAIRTSASGFTLVELVLVIAITGIVAVVAGRIVAQPVQGYLDTSRRADLVHTADAALERLTREIRLALPNSVRLAGGGTVLELLRVRAGGRYRAETPGDVLDFTSNDTKFDVIGTLADASSVVTTGNPDISDCASGITDCLVVYNTGQPGADAYALDNVAGIKKAQAGSVQFARPSAFPFASPARRFYVVDTPVSWICDLGAGTLKRYDGYPLTASHANVDTDAELVAAGASSALAASGVLACEFDYDAGSATRGAVVRITLTLGDASESVTLVEQMQVSNLP